MKQVSIEITEDQAKQLYVQAKTSGLIDIGPRKTLIDIERDDDSGAIMMVITDVEKHYKPSKTNLLERETIAQERIADAVESVIALPGVNRISALEERVKEIEKLRILERFGFRFKVVKITFKGYKVMFKPSPWSEQWIDDDDDGRIIFYKTRQEAEDSIDLSMGTMEEE